MELIPTYEIKCVFKRNLPQNDLETSQMIANLRDLVDDETLIGQLSYVENAQEVIEKKDIERAKQANTNAELYGLQQNNQQVDENGKPIEKPDPTKL